MHSGADIDEVVCGMMATKLNELLVGDKKHWRTLDSTVHFVPQVQYTNIFTRNNSPEHTRLVTPLHGVVWTWFEEQAAAHAAQKIDIDPFLAKLQMPQLISVFKTKRSRTNK